MWLRGTGAALRGGGAHFHAVAFLDEVGIRLGSMAGVGVRVWCGGRVCTGGITGQGVPLIPPCVCNLLPVWSASMGFGSRPGRGGWAFRGLGIMALTELLSWEGL